MVHSGDSVVSGHKHIIRSDIVFKRISRPDDFDYNWRINNKDFIKCINLYREAGNKETEGDVEGASELYEIGLSYRQMQLEDVF